MEMTSLVSVSEIKSRLALLPYLSGIGVEIGVDQGFFSKAILQRSHLSKLYSVDPWLPCFCFPTLKQADRAFAAAKLRLLPFGTRSEVQRRLGQEASLHHLPETIDFVYIDSSHEYIETCEQLRMWWPKLKPNGLLAGHDWANGPEIRKAVEEFALRYGLRITTTVRDAESDVTGYLVNSWMIRKPS